MTADELEAAITRAYNEGRDAKWQRMMQGTELPQPPIVNARLEAAGRLAVARYSAQQQQEYMEYGTYDSEDPDKGATLWMDEA